MATDPQPVQSVNASGTPLALEEQLRAALSVAREEMEAAWSMRVSQAEELLREGVGAQLASILDANLASVHQDAIAERSRVAAQHAAQLASAAAAATAQAAAALTAKLNECARRLRAAEIHEEWSSALYDAASAFAPRVAVFSLHGRFLHVDRAPFAAPLPELALTDAPAFDAACESAEPVIALFSEQELSTALVQSFGPPAGTRAHLFPLTSAGRSVGVLYAEGGRGDCDTNALELLATLAGSVWESRRNEPAAGRPGPQLVTLQAPPPSKLVPDVPVHAWTQMPSEDRDHHLRAQRFARVRVAEMRLYKSALVLEGRRTHSLYKLLQDEIDRGRDEYRDQFLNSCESMIDYFHVEIVKTLANDAEELLGEGYLGPLI
ncbi:MAG: hypothetical protein ABI972_11805 [Acidobacteriota bacterium]